MVPYSLLDLSPILEGGTIPQALANTVDLAQHAERWGYTRFWMAEHHNMAGVASSATAVIIGRIGAATETIRIGSGGVMLPNHAPLVIAEQFGTLEAMFPGRVDLGVGRAPGTDPSTSQALRRDLVAAAQRFPEDVAELRVLLGPERPNLRYRAIPGMGSNVPIWILGSSLYGAQLAAALGTPYSFASHFAPDALLPALSAYRKGFSPSFQQEKPYVMPALQVVAADTDAEALRLFTSTQQAFVNMQRNARGPLRPPLDDIEAFWTPAEKAEATRMLTYAVVGGPETVKAGLARFIALTDADEIMALSMIYDHGARLRSYEIVADVMRNG